jgi:transcription elongation factor GreA
MDNNKYQLTEQGLLDLQNELEKLKTVDRKRNLQALKEARGQGDLSENADYDAAREEQAQIEARIKEIEGILKNYEIIKKSRSRSVSIGKTVTLKVGDLPEKTYTLVGSLEADPLKARISNESPIGRGIIGTKKGDAIVVKTETGRDVKVVVVDVK